MNAPGQSINASCRNVKAADFNDYYYSRTVDILNPRVASGNGDAVVYTSLAARQATKKPCKATFVVFDFVPRSNRRLLLTVPRTMVLMITIVMRLRRPRIFSVLYTFRRWTRTDSLGLQHIWAISIAMGVCDDHE